MTVSAAVTVVDDACCRSHSCYSKYTYHENARVR